MTKQEEMWLNCTKCGGRIRGRERHECMVFTIGQLPTKQEEIREGIADILSNRKHWKKQVRHGHDITLERFIFNTSSAVKEVMEYLHSQGVVIRADRGLPSVTPTEYPFVTEALIAQKAQQDMLRWHNDSLEPLIEEPKQ